MCMCVCVCVCVFNCVCVRPWWRAAQEVVVAENDIELAQILKSQYPSTFTDTKSVPYSMYCVL
jgi:hypothetical protein